MAGGIWTTEFFTCPNCGVPYAATKELHSEKRSGSFNCTVCGVQVHAWSGNYDFFDWKVDQTESPVFGKKK
jgi:transcription elongation factor Elf1